MAREFGVSFSRSEPRREFRLIVQAASDRIGAVTQALRTWSAHP
ncbi:MAG: hypothetical protein ACLR0N_09985 [Bilophila wadsworthia]